MSWPICHDYTYCLDTCLLSCKRMCLDYKYLWLILMSKVDKIIGIAVSQNKVKITLIPIILLTFQFVQYIYNVLITLFHLIPYLLCFRIIYVFRLSAPKSAPKSSALACQFWWQVSLSPWRTKALLGEITKINVLFR